MAFDVHHRNSGRALATALLVTAMALGAPTVAGADGLHGHGPSDPWSAPDVRSGGVMAMPGAVPFAAPGPHGPGRPVFAPGTYDPTAVSDGRVVPADGPVAKRRPGSIRPVAASMVPAFGPACAKWTNRIRSANGVVRTWVADSIRNHYFRADFLFYEIEDLGGVVLGEPSPTVGDGQQPFTVFDLQTPPNQIGVGTVPTTANTHFKDIYGARFTWGIPMRNDVVLELSAFGTQEADEQRVLLPAGPVLPLGAATLLVNTTLLNGAASNNVQIYDAAYTLDSTSRVLGAGGRLLLPGKNTGIVALRPIWGWRYFQVQETLTQRGTFTQTGGPIQNSFLAADTYNNVMGMELGVQAQVQWWIFTFGAEPAIVLGPNKFKARTTTDQFVAVTDPVRIQEIDEVVFSPVLEVGLYGQVQIRDNVELRLGYDLYWFSRVQRPAESIVFDIDGTQNTSLVRPEENLSEILVDGMTASVIVRLGQDASKEQERRRSMYPRRW